MGGIGGIFHLEDATAVPSTLQAMYESLSHRGAAAANRYDVPAALFARFPGRMEDAFTTGTRLTVSADCRLDNRLSLAVRLDLPHSAGQAELIGAAYERWGTSCPEHLVGDFAFAVWDSAKRRLFCARDLFGIKPFYLHHDPARTFIFGSEIKALLASGDVPDDVNEERVADYLAGFCGREDYTFYKHVTRLPSAHAMIVDQSGIRTWRYASIEPSAEHHSDPIGAFRERFFESVRSRTADCGDVGITLSGGLDSSSIAAATVGLESKLHTFSAVFDDRPECDERSFIADVTDRIPCSVNHVDGGFASGSAMGEMVDILRRQDEPFEAPNAILPWRLFQALGARGLGVALDGHGGDEVVSHGTGYLKELAAAKNWRELRNELRPLSDAYAQPFLPVFLRYVGYGLRRQPGVVPAFGGAVLRKVHGLLRSDAPAVSIVSNELRRRTDHAARLRDRTMPAKAGTERERHLMLIDGPERAYAFEVLDRIAHSFGVEPRYPFWDARLVGLSLSLHPEQKLKNGYGRLVLRQAMEGRLPDTIRWRRTKTDFLPNLIHGLRGHESEVVSCVQANSSNIQSYVDFVAVGEACHRLSAEEGGLDEVVSVLRVALLHSWLENHASRARKPGVHKNPVAVCAP